MKRFKPDKATIFNFCICMLLLGEAVQSMGLAFLIFLATELIHRGMMYLMGRKEWDEEVRKRKEDEEHGK